MGSTAVEETQHRTNSCSPVKPTTPCIGVDSTSVDISSSTERNEALETCNHFSIRGYVAEVRKRDKKLCFPFYTNDEENESLLNLFELPPFAVPKFRWWACNGCIEGTAGSQESGEALDLQHGLSSDHPTCIAGSSQRPDVAAAVLSPLTDHEQASVLGARERKSSKHRATFDCTGRSTTFDCNNNQNCTLISAFDPLGKEPASDGLQLDIVLQDPPDDDSVVRRQENGTSEFQLQASNIKGVSEARRARDMPKSRDVPATCWAGEQLSAVGRNGDLQITRVEAAVTENCGNTTVGRSVPLPDLNMCDDDGTHDIDNDEDLLGNNPCDDEEEDLRGGSCRKTRKTRLLSELLGGSERRNIEHSRREPSPDCSSDRSDTPQIDQRETLVNDNGYSHVSAMKRKMTTNDGGHRLLEIKGSCQGAKKLRTNDVNKENTKPSTTEDSETESDEDACCDIVTQPVAKRTYNLARKHKLEEKSKRAKLDNKCSPIVSRQKPAPKPPTVGKAWPIDKHSSAADNGQQMNQLAKGHGNRLQVDKSPSKLKKTKVDQTRPSFVSWKNFAHRDCSTVRHSETPPIIDTSSKKALKKCHRPIENAKQSDQDESSLQSALQGLKITDDDPVVRKSSEKWNVGGHLDVDGEKGTNWRSNEKGKEKMFPEVQLNNLPWSKHKVSPDTHKVPTADQVRGIRQDIDINAIPPEDKVPEQAPSDDIPMDIVDFMAKQQQERQGSFQKDKHFTSGLNFSAKTARLFESSSSGISNVHRSVSASTLWRDDFPYVQTLQPSSARNSANTGPYNPVSFKQRSMVQFPDVNGTYLNGVHTNKPYSWRRSNGSARHNENVSGELRLPSLALTCQNSSELTLGQCQRSSHSATQGLEQLNRFLTAPQENPRNQMWPPAMQKSAPQGLMNPGTVPRFNQDHGHLNLNTTSRQPLPAWDPLMRPGGAMFLLNAMQLAGAKSPSQLSSNNGNLEFLRWPADRTVQPHNQYAASVGGYNHSSSSRRHPSLDMDHRWNSNPQKLPHPSYPALQNVSPFDISFRNEPTIGRPPSGITNLLVPPQGGQICTSNSQATAQGGNLHWQPVQTNPSLDVSRKHVSTAGKGKRRTQASSSAIPPHRTNKELIGQKIQELRVAPPSSLTEVCLVNKNPAEMDVDSAWKYMIEGEKLRPLKWSGDHRSQAKAATRRAEKKQHVTENKERESLKGS
ncbi:hypothetical protein Droror1_Dr00017410 [Drosera rotundifolia]